MSVIGELKPRSRVLDLQDDEQIPELSKPIVSFKTWLGNGDQQHLFLRKLGTSCERWPATGTNRAIVDYIVLLPVNSLI